MKLRAAFLSAVCAVSLLHGISSDAFMQTVSAADPVAQTVSLTEQYPLTTAQLLAGWDSCASEISLSDEQIPLSDFELLVAELTYQHGEYFFVNKNYYGLYTADKMMHAVQFTYTDTAETINAQRADYQDKIDSIIASVSTAWSDEETALYLHDYLVTHTAYDTTYTKRTAYDVLIGGSAVCEGYSLAYNDLLRAAGVDSYMVTSKSLNHAWNLVTINGEQLCADVTWDDPLYDRIGQCFHTNFLRTADDFYQNGHKSTDWIVYGLDESAHKESSGLLSPFWENAVGQVSPLDDSRWVMISHSNGSYDLTVTDYQGSGLYTAESILTLTTKWYLWGSSTQYWSGYFSGVAAWNGYIYINTPLAIYSVDDTGANAEVFYTLSTEEQTEGYIYGFYLDPDGTLTYGLAQDPNSGSVPIVKKFLPRSTDCDPFDRGDVNGDAKVDANDAVLILKDYSRRILGNLTLLPEQAHRAGDIDENGALDSSDAVWILRYYSQKLIAGSADWSEIYQPA